MRKIIEPELKLGELEIGAIEINAKSRDDIPRLLRGLQYIYTTPVAREQVFAILAEVLPSIDDRKVSAETGRPGMTKWEILVLGVLRQGLIADYDRIGELANEHATLRMMLGHGGWGDEHTYHVQTLQDNLRLFTLEILDRINRDVVESGRALEKKVRTTGSKFVVIPSLSRSTYISRPTSICSAMRCARPSRRVPICVAARS